MQYNIIYKLSKPQIDDLCNLYQKEWWTKDRKKDDIDIMLENSDIIVGIEDSDHHLIGFARVLTDFVYKAMIFDVIVDKKYRDNGLGKILIENILNNKQLSKVKHFELYCLDEMKNFYNRFGFNDVSNTLTLLRKSN